MWIEKNEKVLYKSDIISSIYKENVWNLGCTISVSNFMKGYNTLQPTTSRASLSVRLDHTWIWAMLCIIFNYLKNLIFIF